MSGSTKMGRGRYSRREVATVGLLAVVSFVANVSVAGADSVRHGTSRRPYWEVGRLDPALSTACRQQRFNQVVDHGLYIAYQGEAGSGVTGVARKEWNLQDPDHRSVAGVTYHFADDGLSTCRVYVAMPKKPGP